jgi:hypothetical protein
MAQSRYYRAVQPRRQVDTGSDVERGLQVGAQIGKLLGGLGGAIKEAQKNAIANKLMTDQSISEQPGAGQTFSLGKLGGGGSDSGDGVAQDLGTVPADQTFTNPATGNVEPLQQDQGASDDEFRRAIAAARLQGSGSTVGSSQPDTTTASTDFSLRPQDLTPSGPTNTQTVGGLIHTGGTQELDLQKEILAYRLQKSKAAADAADAQAQASGTGRYALDAKIKQAQLAKIQADLQKSREPKPAKEEKNPPAVSIGSEPVIDQNQLNRHIDGIYGNGSASKLASSINEPLTLPDGTPNPNAPVTTSDSVSVPVGKNKQITIPLAEAQAYTKQANALRLKQGLPAYRVPGEDLMIGATAANPYPAQNNLDVYSRAPGTWVRLPNGKIAQVPERKQ